jgi:hypothetical protein
MGKIGNFFRKMGDQQAELTYYFNLGCEVLGTPDGGYWRCTTMERLDRVAAGRKEEARRAAYPVPTRPDGYYSRDRGDGTSEQFIGKDGDITAERPHIHVVHNPGEGRIIFAITHSDDTHGRTHYLPITASGNEVNAKINELRSQLH